MDESIKSSIHAESAEIEAGGDVKFIGGNEYRIAGDIVNIDVAAPSYGAKIENLQKALTSNRISMRDDLVELEKKVRKGLRLTHGEIRALIKDIITSSKNIEKLIPAIKMNGGEAKSLPFEADTVNKINNSIMKGQREFKEKELNKLLKERPEAREQLRKAQTWQLFRTREKREEDINEATTRLNKVEKDIERAEAFLEHCRQIMKHEDPEIPIPTVTEVKPPKTTTEPLKEEVSKKDVPAPKSKLKGTLLKSPKK